MSTPRPDRTLKALLPSLTVTGTARRVTNLTGSGVGLCLALHRGPFVYVARDEDCARRTARDVAFYRALLGGGAVVHVPDPVDAESATARVRSLMSIHAEGASIVASPDALVAPARAPEKLRADTLRLATGDAVERDAVELELAGIGFKRVQLVTAPGQYSLRGFILDLYPGDAARPYRIEFFGDEIENIRVFDLETQRSVREVDEVLVLPAALDMDGAPLMDTLGASAFYVSSDLKPEDYPAGLPTEPVVLSRYDILDQEPRSVRVPLKGFAGVGLLHEERPNVFALADALARVADDELVVIVASSASQAERLREVFREQELICPLVGLSEAPAYPGSPFMVVADLSAGVYLPGLVLLTEREIFGGRPEYRSIKQTKVAGLLTHIDDLAVGDYVVHADRGIGRFIGLEHQEVEGVGYDMLRLEYSDGARLNLPLSALEKVRKYHAEEGAEPRLDTLGSKRWQTARGKVRARVRKLAIKLIDLYAERELAEGHAASPDTEMHREFESFFPYDETPDQLTAIEEIKADMESARPMDRLLCGDVGFGKTEVAMRAAFKAIFDRKQVAVLVPTTLLCEQHYRVFKQRFAAFPVTIEHVSRFRPRKEILAVFDALRDGRVDMVIGTHALLSKGLAFSDLGLLVIDEEHRFGVGQKEKIKSIAHDVDVLSLSATPIPRTLQMSLGGIRSMSTIETPPEERMAVPAQVAAWTDALVRDAVTREMDRGGQVFFVHNRIRDIDAVADKIRRLAPLARIAVAHGQMPERELERIMLQFLDREFDVLVSTAIVGAGIDIPTANTIIVNLAHRMGLADLYQLKGRVGRGTQRGHAYFLIPGGEDFIPEDARRRLQALQDLSFMGAGFRLAMKDMEIRGAGNLLGAEQSGSIEAVGFDLYLEMLEEAVAELRGKPVKRRVRAAVNLKREAFIPEEYIEDMALRLSVYRSISTASTARALDELEAEMTDRFGPPPVAFVALLTVRGVGVMAEDAGVAEIALTPTGWLRMTFAPDAEIAAENLTALIPHKVRFLPDGFEVKPKGDPLDTARDILSRLVPVPAPAPASKPEPEPEPEPKPAPAKGQGTLPFGLEDQ
jgi:transcription-repair coupling factor (superfamily II helicase)